MPARSSRSIAKKSPARKAPASKGTAPGTRGYVDFVLSARRKDARSIEVRVAAPGAISQSSKRPLRVAFPDAEARRIRDSVRVVPTIAGTGRMMMTSAEATSLGKRLADVLLPPPIFRLLAGCLATGEPRSVQQELQAIVPNFQSVPIVPIINDGGREFATFSSLARRPNVVQPTLRYRNLEDLTAKIVRDIVPAAEARIREMEPAL